MPNGTPTAYDRYRPYVGTTYITGLTDASHHAVMVIGTDRWSVARFVQELGVAHLRSGRIITRIAELHSARNLKHFYEHSSPGSVAETGFGVASLFTLFKAFEAGGYDVFQWAARDGGWEKKATTFMSFKKREAQKAAAAKATKTGRRRR